MNKIDTAKMNKRIFALTIPNIISNITVPLLGMVDLAIAGSLGDKSYIGAIAIATTIFNFVYWGFGFLRMGTSGFTAQAYGARDLRECMKVMTRAIIIAIVISLTLLVLQYPIFQMSNYVMNTPSKVDLLVKDYFYIRIWAAPATLMLYAFKGWYIGMQNSKTPMWVSIGINIVNIVGSLIFVWMFDMGIAGIALGTVLAQYFGLFSFVFITSKYYKKVLKYIDVRGSFDAKEMIHFFNVNKDIFIRTVCLIIVFTYFTSASAKMGDTVLAVNALFMQLFTLFSYIMDGFAYAGESLIGRFYGAKNRFLLEKCVKHLVGWGFLLSLTFTILYIVFLEDILSLFTSDKDVIEMSNEYFWWIIAVPFCGFLAFLFDGIMIGMTKTKPMRDIIIVAVIGFFVAYWGFVSMLGNDALWLGFILFLLFRGCFQYLAYRKILHKL